MSSQLEDAFNEAVERRVAEIRAQDAAPFFTEQQERALSRCEGYDEGFAAGSSAERARLAEALRERAKREIAWHDAFLAAAAADYIESAALSEGTPDKEDTDA